jgi:hypothetical protein
LGAGKKLTFTILQVSIFAHMITVISHTELSEHGLETPGQGNCGMA